MNVIQQQNEPGLLSTALKLYSAYTTGQNLNNILSGKPAPGQQPAQGQQPAPGVQPAQGTQPAQSVQPMQNRTVSQSTMPNTGMNTDYFNQSSQNYNNQFNQQFPSFSSAFNWGGFNQ